LVKPDSSKRPFGYAMVVLATAIWGTSGLFIKSVTSRTGISALSLAFWRDLSTFLVLAIGMALIRPALLKVRRRDLIWLACLGVFSVGAFHVFWNMTVQINGISVATVLQEAAPAFVAIAAWLVLREPLTKLKVLAVLITFAGCVLVSRLDVISQAKVTPQGILIGLSSAITYGSFSLFGKPVSNRYSPFTVLVYAFGFAALVLFPLQFLSPAAWPVLTPARWWFVGLILLPTIAGFSIYTIGLRWLSASIAAIIATSEVVFASLYAYVLLGERLDALQWVGAALVVAGVVLLTATRTPEGRAAPVESEIVA
jgi:DME family drug/metabolite transporter